MKETENNLEQKSEREFLQETIAKYTFNWEMIYHPQKGYLHVSEGCRQISGFSASEFLSNKSLLEEIILPEDQHYFSSFNNRSDIPHAISIEFRIRCKDETVKWIEHKRQGVFDTQGNFMGFFCSNTDISQRKDIEHARVELVNEQIEKRQLFDKGKVAILRWENTEGWPVIHASENIGSILGYSKEEIEHPEFIYAEIICEEDIARVSAEVKKNIDENAVSFLHKPYRLKTKKGKYVWVFDHTVIIRNKDNTVTNFLGYIVDISDQVENRNRIVTSENNFRSFFNNNSDFFLILNLEWKILEANKTVINKLHYTRELLQGQPIFFLFPTERLREASLLCSRILEGETDCCSIPYMNKEKKYIPVETIIRKGYWNDEEAIFVSGRDMSGITLAKEKVKKTFQLSTTISFICDNDNELITEINWGFVDQLGYRPEEVLGKHITYILECEHSVGISYDQKRQNGPWIEDAHLVRKDNTRFPVLLSFDVFEEESRHYVLISAIDISRPHQESIESRDRQEELENLLQIRGIALEETVKELVVSENTYRGIIENMQDVFYRTNTTGNVLLISPSAKEMFGVQEIGELIGENFTELIYTNKKDREKHNLALLEKGRLSNFEIQIKRKNGEILTVLANSQQYLDSERKIAGIEGTLKDITSMKKMEQALSESEEKYRNLIKSSQEAIFVIFDNRLEHINPKFKSLFGINIDDFKSKDFSFSKIIAPKSKHLISSLENLSDIEIKQENHYEFTALDKNNNEIEVEVSISYIPYKHSVAIQGVLRDITHRKTNEIRLKNLSERLMLATESAELGVWEIDLQEHKLYWDLQMYHIFQCDPEAYKNSYDAMLNLIHPDDLEKTFDAMDRALKEKDRIEMEYRIITEKKETRYVKAYAKVSRDLKDKAVRMTGVAYDISTTKQYESALRNAETRYKTVADFTFDWETWYGSTGELLYCSPSCLRISGYSREEFLNNPNLLLRITHPDDKKLVKRHLLYTQQEKSETRYSLEFRIRKKGGETVWLGHDVQQVFDTEGKYLGIRGSSRDITKLKQNITKLKVKTKQLATLNEISAEFAAISTELEINSYMFSKFSELTNCFFSSFAAVSNNQFVIKNISQVNTDSFLHSIPIINRPIVGLRFSLPKTILTQLENRDYLKIDNLNEILETDFLNKNDITLLYRKIDHGSIYMFPVYHATEVSGIYTLSFKLGETIQESTIEILSGFINQASIVLQRLYANDQLLQSLQEWQSFIENANTPIIGIDNNGKLTEWNRAAAQTTGYNKEDVLGQNLINKFIHPEYKTTVNEVAKLALEGVPTSNFEFPLITEDNKRIILLMNITPRKSTNGKIVGAIGVGQDITEIDYLRTELQSERISLARRVDERTAELSLANVRLAKAAKLKDEFLANMSHELRTPLNAILGVSESLQEGIYGGLTERQYQKVQDVEESGRHLLSLINEILDLAKIEAGKITLDYSTVNIKQLCFASLRFIKQAAFKKQITVNQDIDVTIENFMADEKRMKQVLVNLLSNAVKFTPDGGELGLNVKLVSPDEIQFEVWDKGIGISEKSFDKLFKPFEQIDSKLSRNYEGTGLGLALVKNLVSLHNGSVSVKSKVGKGSCFTLHLPLAPQLANIPQKTPQTKRSSTIITEAITHQHTNNETENKPSEISKQRTILLVEDNEFNIRTITEYLTAKNYIVELAFNGIEAIEKTERKKPDLIIMDIQMPKMDGFEATRKIRHNPDPSIAQIPIIALTALAMPGDKEKCIEAGANRYMQKPVSLKRLIELVGEFFNPENQLQ